MVERNPDKPSGRRINPKNDAKLRAMVAKGWKRDAIAFELQVHRDTISDWAKRLGLTLSRHPAAHEWEKGARDRAKAMWLEGSTATQIALELKVTRNAVIGQIARMGVTRPEAINDANRSGAGKNLEHVRKLGSAPEARRKAVQTRRANGWRKEPHKPVCLVAPVKAVLAAVESPVVFAARGMCRAPEGCGEPRTRGSYCASHAARFYLPPKAKVSYTEAR